MISREDVVNSVPSVTQSTKVAIGASTATTGAGLAVILEWVNDVGGAVAIVLGGVLTSVLIFNHIRLGNRRAKIMDLELKELKQREKERVEAAKCSPRRRADDPPKFPDSKLI